MPTRLAQLWQAVRGAVLVAPWLVHLFLADLLLSGLLPISALLPTLAYDVSSGIAYSVWRGIQLIFTRFNGARITLSGDRLPPRESAVVVANHVSWTDFYMIQELAVNAGMLGRCRYFAKQQLKWVPFLGWGLWAMGMPLVSRKWLQDQAEMNRVFKGIVDNRWPIWLISYSEATRYTPKKYQEAVRWCSENGKPAPKHTLYPRTKGFVATVDHLRRSAHVKAVYDITVAYAHGKKFMEAPSMLETLSASDLGSKWQFHVDVRRFTLEDLPQNEDGKLARWLENRWVEKGALLESMRQAFEKGLPLGSVLE